MSQAPPARDPLSGHPGHLSPEQQQKLEQFRAELTAEGLYDPAKFDDAYLLRFLRARKFDLVKSKIMWTDFIKWRTDFGVDHLYESFEYPELPAVDKLYPQFYHKTDKDGRPIYIEILGKLDLTKLFQVTTPERQLQRLVVEYEKFLRDRLPICSEVQGQLVETSCTIMDLKDVGVSQFWKVKNHVQNAAAISSNNYPETMGKFYIINAPWAFTTVWSFVKPWLDEVTVSKITILGSDYYKTISHQIPPQNLPKFLGGQCQCSEGCTLSNAGPWQDPALAEKVKAKQAAAKAEQAPAAAPAPTVTATATAPVSSAEIEPPAPSTTASAEEPKPAASMKAPVEMTTVISKVDA